MSERDELQAQTAEETRALQGQTAAESAAAVMQREELRRLWWEEATGHLVAIMLTGGFFILAFCVLLGFVHIQEAPVATMVGTIVGLAAAKIDPILFHYFKMMPGVPKSDKEEAPRGRPA